MTAESSRLARRLTAVAVALCAIAGVLYRTYRLIYGDRPAYIHVRWAASVDDHARQAMERQYRLERGQLREGRTWGYVVTDVSRSNLRGIVQNPAIEDTHEINRQRFTIWRTARRDPYSGTFASWLPATLQGVAAIFLLAGALVALLAAVDALGFPAGLHARLMPLARVFVQPPSLPLHALTRPAQWVADRIPLASAEAAGLFRIVFGAALVVFFVMKPVGADWVTDTASGNPMTLLQREVVRSFVAAPVVADWLTVWIVFWGALFIVGAAARTSYVLLTIGALAWGFIYTTRIGTHSISALMVTLVCLIGSRWGDAWSVDAWRRGAAAARPAAREYGYTVWMPGFVLGVTLAAAAIAKLRGNGLAWILNGTVKYHFLTDSRQAPVDWGLQLGLHEHLAVLFSFGAIAIEALVIVGACARAYRYRAMAGAGALAMLIGFALFQGLFWPAWWILLLSFLPWHRVGAGTSLRTFADPQRRERISALRVIQAAIVVVIAVQQVVVTMNKVEENPLLSAYDMYSTTYASPEEYEEKAGMTYWMVARAADGTMRSCGVAREDAELVSAATADEESRGTTTRLIEKCFGAPEAIQSVSVEGRQTAIDWQRWRFAGEKHVPLAGPIQIGQGR